MAKCTADECNIFYLEATNAAYSRPILNRILAYYANLCMQKDSMITNLNVLRLVNRTLQIFLLCKTKCTCAFTCHDCKYDSYLFHFSLTICICGPGQVFLFLKPITIQQVSNVFYNVHQQTSKTHQQTSKTHLNGRVVH